MGIFSHTIQPEVLCLYMSTPRLAPKLSAHRSPALQLPRKITARFMSAMSNLSHLPHDVLVVIAKQLKKLEDFVSFRCVSKSLHAAAKDEYFEGVRVRQQIPYLLLPVRDDGNDDVRELYSLVEGESVVASVEVPKFKTKKCHESLGWLLASEEDGNMSLFDPFSGTEIPLPHKRNIPRYETHHAMGAHVFIQKMVLSSRPSETLDFVLMVICGHRGHLAYWRLGDETWNVIEERLGRFIDVIHNGGEQFYAIGFPGVLWAINLTGNNNHAEAHIIMHCEPIVPQMTEPYPDYPSMNLYIVKTIDDTLLIITRKSPILSEDGSSYISNEFHVYEVDKEMSSYNEIHSLGRMAVFVGHNSTIALDASKLPGGVIKANHIYFTDDDWEFYYFQSAKGGGQNMGVYNMETRTIEPFYPGSRCAAKFLHPYGLLHVCKEFLLLLEFHLLFNNFIPFVPN